jgi:hypothetical protein
MNRIAALLLAVTLVGAEAQASGLHSFQRHELQQACRVAQKYDLCRTTQAIVLQESSACVQRVSKIDHASAGCMGLHLSTARMFDPHVTRYELIHDNRRNIRDGVAFLVYCKRHTRTWAMGVRCFHVGLPQERRIEACFVSLKLARSDAEFSPYVVKIKERMK